jgi:hypothetical protein
MWFLIDEQKTSVLSGIILLVAQLKGALCLAAAMSKNLEVLLLIPAEV